MRNLIAIGLALVGIVFSLGIYSEPTIAAGKKVVKVKLEAVAYDAAGNFTVSAPVYVNVKN